MMKILCSLFLVIASVFAFTFSGIFSKDRNPRSISGYDWSFLDYKVGGSEYETKNVYSVNIHWIGGKVTVIESDGDRLYFKEDSYNKELSENQKLHWCIKRREGNKKKLNIFAEKPFVLTKLWQKKELPKKDLTVYTPRKLKEVSFDVVDCDCEFNNGTANRVGLNGVGSVLKLSPVDCEKIDVDGTELNLEIKLRNSVGVEVCRNGVYDGMIGKDKKVFGNGEIKVNIEGVNNKYKFI